MSDLGLSRRSFLSGLGLSAAGLLIGGGRAWAQTAARAFEPNVFVHVAPDGLVSIVCHRTEMGQGVRSTLPAIIADELGAELATIRVVQGDGDQKYGDQLTDGSSSVRKRFHDLREAGASARLMLTSVASKRWGVEPESCTAEDGFVIHAPSRRRLPFSELVADAARLDPPKAPRLKDRSQHKYIGTRLPLLDGPALVTGAGVFGADVKLPGLLTAVILHPPVVGGWLKSHDASATLAVPGVRHVVEIPAPSRPFHFKSLGGLAVVAEHTWAALKGREALVATWNLGENAAYESNAYREAQLETVRRPCKVIRSVGDVEQAFSGAVRRLEAEYVTPHLAHAPMEPPATTAFFKDGSCELWSSTQDPQAARDEVAKVLGIPASKVTVHVTLVGGAFGRKAKPDYVVEAAFLSKAVSAPVRLQWTREDDIQHDYFHTTCAQRLEAALDAQGRLVGWRHRSTFPPIASLTNASSTHGGDGEVGQGLLDFPLAVPNVQVENGASHAFVRIGWLRSVNNNHSAFGINSFIDELAHARQQDPRDHLLSVVGGPRVVTERELGVAKLPNYGQPLEDYPIDLVRIRRVVERVTSNAGWEHRGHDRERGYGLAFHRSFQTMVGVVAAVKKRANGKLKVDEVWLVADAGLVVNLERAHAQMQGSVLFGMSIALFSEMTFKGGIAQQSNFHDYRLTRIRDAPREIHVEFVTSEEKPGGIGEPGVPPVAPAITNAVFALTGRRVRRLPLALEGLA